MTNFNESSSVSNPLTTWSDSIAKEINKRIVERLLRKKRIRDSKKHHSCLKYYLSKTLYKK